MVLLIVIKNNSSGDDDGRLKWVILIHGLLIRGLLISPGIWASFLACTGIMVIAVVPAAHLQVEYLDGEQGVAVETEEEETAALQAVILGELLLVVPKENAASYIEQHIHVTRAPTGIVRLTQL